jgi:membrane protease subunit (stomatin/prohibitin family)
MSLFSRLGHELIDIVQWTEDRQDILSHRFQRFNNELKNGAKLTVREGQLAVMVNEGQLGKDQVADVFKPGMYELSTHNLPILSTLQGWKYGFDSPFRAEVYFFNTRKFTDLKWGTAGPAIMRDSEFGAVRFTTEDIEANLRGKVGIRVKEVMPEIGVPVIDLSAKIVVVGDKIRERIAADFEKMGLELCEVQVQNIGLPEEVEHAIDQQGAMRAIGNMQNFSQYQAAQAIRDAAKNEGSAGAVLGLGVGNMFGQSMGGVLQQPGQVGPGIGAAPAAPPPIPGAVSFFVAVNGQQAGPFDLTALRNQASAGGFTRDTLVWKQGMTGWAKASEQPDLASLFSGAPPPVPPQ